MWFIIGTGFVFLTILYHRNEISNQYKKTRYYFKLLALNSLIVITPVINLHLMIMKGKHYSNNLLMDNALARISKLYGIEWRLRNGEILAEDRGAVIISNHQSAFDVIGACHTFRLAGKAVVVAKKSILYTGPFGLATYLTDAVFIDRSNPKAAYESLTSTCEMITKRKLKIWFYPEGTRNENNSEKMLPFKKGAFITAVATQAPIIPVVYSPYYFIDKNNYTFDKGIVILQCLEPVPTAGLTLEDVPALMDRLREIMMLAYDKLSKEVTQQSDSPTGNIRITANTNE